ncbi:MAG: sugar transferase [Lachnospiraceae bacterium]
MEGKTKEESLYSKYIKNILDKAVAIVLLLLFWWLYLICAFIILLDSGRPVIYRQKRVGKNGVPFYIYKFRTMVKNADKIGPTSTLPGDNRVTKSGKFLRKTSLDEIPQLFNIIKGDMSFVGIRPNVVKDTDDYSMDKYKMKPGITGFAQVNGRSSLTSEEKLYWENLYAYEVSFVTDIKILIKTVLIVFKGKGAY